MEKMSEEMTTIDHIFINEISALPYRITKRAHSHTARVKF
jgi:hypothetical protein